MNEMFIMHLHVILAMYTDINVQFLNETFRTTSIPELHEP
jgi:hypothetical protein